MKRINLKIKRGYLVFVGVILIAAVLLILFISPIAKYLIEKYDEKYTGRKITLDWAYVNPFTGYVFFKNVKFYEPRSDSLFLSVSGLSGKFNVRDLFHGNYIISQLVLDHPVGNIIENKKVFNFDSFVRFIAPEHPDTSNRPSNFNILNIKIKDGEFHYLQEEIPVSYFIRSADIESEGKLWDADSVVFKFFFLSGPGSGSMQGEYTVNFKTLDYHYSVVVHRFDLTQIEQYLKEISNYGTFSANMDANLTAVGNFRDAEDVTSRGQLAINDFHIGKNHQNDYASFDKLMFGIHELSPKNKKYIFDSLVLTKPYFKYEQYDHLDNLQTMFGKNGANIEAVNSNPEMFNLILEIARYMKILSKNFFHSYYKINKLSIEQADLLYNDYSPTEKFSIAASPLDITADSIDKNKEHVDIHIKSGVKPFGDFSMLLNVNPVDSNTFDLKYRFKKIPAPMFNPYLISYTSYPLDRGTIESHGKWAVRKGRINSENHVVILDPRVTKRIKNKNTKWIPLPLVMSFVREYGNVIDYEIPITGNLKNPKFHLHDVIFDILGNIFIKPPTTPYRMEVKVLENEIENSLALKWMTGKSDLTSEEKKFVSEMADYLIENPTATLIISPMQYTDKEKEHILFFEAKKKYYLSDKKMDVRLFSEKDSEVVEKMSVKDSSFMHYLDKHVPDKMLFTIQEKCNKIVDAGKVNNSFKELNRQRATCFLSIFKKRGVENRISIMAPESTIPFNGFSYYKIDYHGKIPASLRTAYEKMNELNDETPRKKFLKDRKMTMNTH